MLTAICDRCGTRHDLDPSRVPASGLVMKCTRCGNRLAVSPTSELGSLDGIDLPDPGFHDDGVNIGDLGEIVDLPTPKGAAPRRNVSAEDAPDLLTPATGSKKRDVDDHDLVAPVGPIPTRAMPAASALPKAPSMPAPPIGGRKSAAPPPPKPKPPEPKEELPDLLQPVGPTSQRTIQDLLTPVGPTPSKLPTHPPAGKIPTRPPAGKPPTVPPSGKPALAPDDQLMTPVGPMPQRSTPDLLTPVGPTSQRGIPDLMTPVGPSSQRGLPDLLTPVGPTPQRSSPDLLQPVGPVPTRGPDNLLTPVGPTPIRNAPGLLTPVGPTPVRNAPDLLEPVGPVPTRGKDDLLTPVGPAPIRNSPGLLTPVGPQSIRHGPDLLEPVGPVPTRGMDLPAPQGFFDDVPPPTPRSPFSSSAPTSSPLSLDDDLDVVPAGEPSKSGPAPLDLFADDDGSSRPAQSLDGLDLPPPDAGGMSYGEVDLPGAQDELAGVVSFSKPGAAAAPAADRRPGVSLSPEPVPVARVDAKVGRVAPTPTKAPLSREQRGRRNKVIALVLVIVALAGGGFWVYQNMELEAFGFRTAPAQEKADRIAAGLASMHKLMSADERGHWDQAIAAGKRVLALDRGNVEALALSAQAQIAAYLDEGSGLTERKQAADDLLGELVKLSSRGAEIEKAQALRSALDAGKGDDAKKALAGLAKRLPRDPDLALFLGWAALADHDWATAASAFGRAGDRIPALYGLGRAQLALGDKDKARETFEKVVAKQPDKKHIGAWLGLVEIQTTRGDKNRENELAAICEKAPERMTAHPHDLSRAWTLYGDEALLVQRFEIAVERYRQARKLDPTNLDAMIGSALAAVEVHEQTGGKADLVEARRELEQAVQLDPGPGSVRALVGLTRINLAEGKPVEARAAIEKAAKLDDKNALVQLWLGRVLANTAINEPKGAEEAFRRAMQIAPREFAAYVALAQLLGDHGDTKGALQVLAPVADAAKKDPPLANALGMAYLGARDLGNAEAAFRTALGVDPGFAEARLNLADTLVARGRYADAVAEYLKLREKDPVREDVALRLAATYEKMRKFGDAEKLLQKLLSTDGGNVPSPRARAAAGRFWARQKQFTLAGEQAQQLLAIDPRQPTGFYLRGVAAFSEGRLDDAIKDVLEAVQLEPQAEYWETLGRMHEQKGELSQALSAFTQATQMDSTFGAPFAGIGRYHFARNDWENAILAFDKATKLDPYDDAAWVGIGDAKYRNRDNDGATKAYEEALARNAKNGETYYKLGRIEYETDQGPQAISHLSRAVQLGPEGAPWIGAAYRYLGMRYRASNQKKEACVAFEKYLELAPANDKLRDEVKKLHMSCD